MNQSFSTYQTAIFAGGCFWCTQHDFDHIKGVISTTVGYVGGEEKNPTYEKVCSGKTGHSEALEIVFDPHLISYSELLDIYWKSIDPTRNDGQFCDIGPQYRPRIFYTNQEQKEQALASKKALISSPKALQVLVDIVPASIFYPAEEYHQKFYQKNPERYSSYHLASGREKRLKQIWDVDK